MQHEVQLERKDRESTEEIFLKLQYLLQTVRIIVVRLTLSRSRQVYPGGTCLIIAQADCRSGCMCETQQLRKECSQWMASLYRLSAPTAPPAATCWRCRCRSRRTGCSVCPAPSTESHCGCTRSAHSGWLPFTACQHPQLRQQQLVGGVDAGLGALVVRCVQRPVLSLIVAAACATRAAVH